LAIGISAIVLIWLAGHQILLLIYRPEYAERTSVFLWLGLSSGISYVASLLGYAMTAARYFRAQLPVFLITTVVTAVGCTIFVPQYQLFGAAIAMILAAICQAIGSAMVITHALQNRP
jgi:O-antigen/teichoic acid export membrane protein